MNRETDNAGTSVQNLQQALAMELGAVQQYLLHAHVLQDWGLHRLAERMRREMAEELGHASRFINRLLYLRAGPDMTAQPGAAKGDLPETLKEMFEADLKDELAAIAFYTDSADAAADDSDIGTRVLFEQIVLDEEGHRDWLERQLRLLDRMGEAAYFAVQMDNGVAER